MIFFISHNFVKSKVDPCVYFKFTDCDIMIILIWVDDVIIASNSFKLIDEFKCLLKNNFSMKDLGILNNYLGIQVEIYDNQIAIHQSLYLEKLLDQFGMKNCKHRSTICEKLPTTENNLIDSNFHKKYRQIVGSLIYAMVCTRPDLAWAVTKLSQHLDCPDSNDFKMLDQVLRYIKGSISFKLTYSKNSENLSLQGFCDSNWGG